MGKAYILNIKQETKWEKNHIPWWTILDNSLQSNPKRKGKNEWKHVTKSNERKGRVSHTEDLEDLMSVRISVNCSSVVALFTARWGLFVASSSSFIFFFPSSSISRSAKLGRRKMIGNWAIAVIRKEELGLDIIEDLDLFLAEYVKFPFFYPPRLDHLSTRPAIKSTMATSTTPITLLFRPSPSPPCSSSASSCAFALQRKKVNCFSNHSFRVFYSKSNGIPLFLFNLIYTS